MREIVKKLVNALEDKATTDIIAGNQPFNNSNAGNTASEVTPFVSPDQS